jgi:hypothetical protein
MKTLTSLFLAILASSTLYAQTVSQTDPPTGHPLSHADSLVLKEITIPIVPDTSATADTLSKTRAGVLPFPTVIDVVLGDIPNNLRHISGELVLAEGEFENYASTVVFPGAEDCIVTRYHSVGDSTASWQAKTFADADFAKAARRYHELYKELQGCFVWSPDGTPAYLTGTWEPAKEGASFTTSTLRTTNGDWRYKDVKVEIELVYLLADWVVNVNVVTKKRDDEVGNGGLRVLRQ